jgi:hypothetical protein
MVEKAGRKNNLYDVSSEYDVEVTKDNALKFTNCKPPSFFTNIKSFKLLFFVSFQAHKVYKNQAVQAQPEKLRLNKLGENRT